MRVLRFHGPTVLAARRMFDRGGRAPQDARMRIASLIASSTEIVCALGFGDDLVGRSHECDLVESLKILAEATPP